MWSTNSSGRPSAPPPLASSMRSCFFSCPNCSPSRHRSSPPAPARRSARYWRRRHRDRPRPAPPGRSPTRSDHPGPTRCPTATPSPPSASARYGEANAPPVSRSGSALRSSPRRPNWPCRLPPWATVSRPASSSPALSAKPSPRRSSVSVHGPSNGVAHGGPRDATTAPRATRAGARTGAGAILRNPAAQVGRDPRRHASAVEIDPVRPAVAVEKDGRPELRSRPERAAETQPGGPQRCPRAVDRGAERNRQRPLRAQRSRKVERPPP